MRHQAQQPVRDRWELPYPHPAAEQAPGDGPSGMAGPEPPSAGGLVGRLLHLAPAQARTAAYLAAAAALGVALMGLPDYSRPGGPRGGGAPPAGAPVPAASLAPPVPAVEEPTRDRLERELEAILGLMEGVGSVQVFIAYDRGPERLLAYNETREERLQPSAEGPGRGGGAGQERRLSRQAVVVRDDEARRELPVVLMERSPVIRGVLVVADGARSASVRLALQRAVSGALGVPPHRVVVGAKRR